MSLSDKYGRTWHFPFSPGSTNDDRIHQNYWDHLGQMQEVVHTEKLDGENTCLNKYGVFARSHTAPTVHPWSAYLRERWNLLRHDLGELDVFGENLYAIHGIGYQKLEHHFYVFAVRTGCRWLSWEEVKFYASVLDFPTVPEWGNHQPGNRATFEKEVLALVKKPSLFGSTDAVTRQPCTMEGLVTRNTAEFSTEDFQNNVFKYVRANHVKTDAHWSRKWKRAKLVWEMGE